MGPGARHRGVEIALGDRRHAPLELFQGDGNRAHGECSEAQCKHKSSNSARDRELDGEFRSAHRRVAPGQGLLLNSVHHPVDLAVDGKNVAFGLFQQGVAGGAVVA